MARAVWLALSCAALASCARYADYSGVKMPEYSSGIDYEGPHDSHLADDYHDRSPDSPANLDYKYEEETGHPQRHSVKEQEDSDEWQKPLKKHRKSLDDDSVLEHDKYNSEDIPFKLKSNHKFSKHRPRMKTRDHAYDDSAEKRGLRHHHYRKDDVIDVDDTSNVFKIDTEDKIKHSDRSTTFRTARRKPRDRLMMPPSDIDAEVVDDSLLRSRINSPDFFGDEKQRIAYPRRLPAGKQGLRLEGAHSEDAEFSETDNAPRLKSKENKKKYDDYSDYYDMKRVQGIKQKLPMLLRRTTTTTMNLVTMRGARPEDWPYRRMMAPNPIPEYSSDVEDETTENTTTSSVDTTTSSTTTVAPVITSIITLPTTSPTHTPYIARSTVTLSLAEKSRLSILKKAQRKEMVKGEITEKPPILMQVADKMQTLVVVEPPTSESPWMRAREVHDDSPDQLNKVKRLMRHKIVSSAKNIHDLTENWDDVVCDYIDVSLLENSSFPRFVNIRLIELIFVLLNILYRFY